MKVRDFAVILLTIAGIASGVIYYLPIIIFPPPNGSTPSLSPLTSNVTVYFIDVGQGDSIFIDTPNLDMLIDGGTRAAGNAVVEYLRGLGVTRIDYVVATHPDADHIGGLITVLTEYNATYTPTIIDSGYSKETDTYHDYFALASNRTVEYAVRGQVYVLSTYVNVTVLNPQNPLEFDDANNNSIVLKLQVFNVTFLFEGDCEAESEASIMKAGFNLTSIILKVGHHGSRTATSSAYLEAINPKVAVISVGLGNRYGHPDQETLGKLADMGVIVYRTDLNGNIVITTNGIDYYITTEKP